jgi:hypothetical protein
MAGFAQTRPPPRIGRTNGPIKLPAQTRKLHAFGPGIPARSRLTPAAPRRAIEPDLTDPELPARGVNLSHFRATQTQRFSTNRPICRQSRLTMGACR